MDTDKRGVLIAGAVALLAIFAVGAGSITGGLTGNGSNAGGSAPAAGMAIAIVLMAVFVLAAISVLKTLLPEGRFHQ